MRDREGAIVLTMMMKDEREEGEGVEWYKGTMYIIIKLIKKSRDSYC